MNLNRTPSDESWTADSTRWVTHNGPASFAQHDGELYDICLLTGELQPRCGPSFADEHGHVQLPQDREAPHLQHKHKFQGRHFATRAEPGTVEVYSVLLAARFPL